MNIYVDANWNGTDAAPEGYDAIYANLTDAVKNASAIEATTITVAAGIYDDSIGFYEENVPASTANLSIAVNAIVEDCKAVGKQKGDIIIKAADGAEVTFTGHFLIGCNSRGTGGSGTQHWNSDITFQGITFDAEATEKHSIVVANMEGFTLDSCKIVGNGDGYGIGGSTNSNFGEKPVFKNCTFENTAIQGESQLGAKLVIDGGTFINSSINAPGGMEDTCMTISGATFQNTITEEGDFYVVRSNAYPVNISDCSFDLKIAEGVDASKVNGAIFVPRQGGDKAWNVENIAVTFDDAALNDADIYLCSPINGGNRMVIDGLTSSSNDVAELLSKTQGDLTVKQGDVEITYKDGEMSMPAFDGVDNFVICNLDDLKKFRDMVNAGENFKGKTITLAADIDLNNEEWTPIGTSDNKFLGNFDGAGHTVKNLVVDGDIYWGSGFFGNVTNGNPEIAHNVIKNLTIENASISGTHSVGAVAGSAYCTDISNVAVIGNVNINGSWYVGAAFGRFEYGNLDGCVIDVTSGTVYSKDANYIGGAIGFTAEGALKYSNISSNINVETEGDCDYVGGVFGLLHYNNQVDGVECNADSIVCKNATTGAIAGAWGNANGTSVVVKNATVGENTKVTVDGQVVETSIMGSPRSDGNTGSLAVVEINDKGEVTKIIEVAGPKGMEIALNSGTKAMYVSMEDKDGNMDVFSSINEAMLAAQENGGGTIVMYGTNDAASVVDDTAIWRTNGTYTFTGGNYFNFNSWIQTPKSSEDYEDVDVNIVFDDAKVVVGKFRLDTGSTLTVTDTHMDGVSYNNDGRTWLTFYGDSVINISNSVVGYNVPYNGGNSDAIVAGDKDTDYSNIKGAMTFYGSGVLNVDKSTLFGYSTPSNGAVFAVTDKGLFTFTDSAIYGGSIAIGINDGVTVGRDDEVATMIFDNSEFNYINGDYQTPYACKITVGSDKAGKLIVRNNSEINFNAAETQGVIVNSNGEVEISDSKFIAKTVTNNGNFTVSGESTVVIENQTGSININDGAVMTDSKVGNVNVYGNNTWQGNNTIGAMSIGYNNSGADIVTNITGTATVSNFMVGNVEGFTSTLNIGTADGERTTINGNQHNYTTNSIVNVVNADVTGDYASMTGNINITDSTYSKFGDFRVVAGGNHTITPVVTFTRSTINGAYGYIGGWSASASGYGILVLNDNSEWKSNGGSLSTAKSEITLNDSKFTVGGTFTHNGSLTVDTDSLVSAKTLTGSGSITIDATDFAGVVKVVDVTSSSFAGSIEVVGNEDAYYAINSEGDIFVSTVSTEKVYFDYTWTEYDFSENIEGDKYFGINAFNKFDTSGVDTSKGWSNLMVLPENTTEIILTAGNDGASYGKLRPTQSLTVYTEGEGYAVIDRFVNVIGNLTFAEDSKVKVLTVNGDSGANNQGDGNGGQSKVIVNGELYFANANSSNKAIYLWGMNSTPGYIVINAGGKLIAEAGNIENHGTVEVKGYMELGSAGDAPKLAGVGAGNGGWNGHLIVDGGDGEGKLVVKHNQINFGGGNTGQPWEEPAGACTVTVKNGGIIETAAVSFRNGAKNTLTLDNGSLIFNDGSAYGVDYSGITPRYFDNKGVINISNNGNFDAAGRTFVNDGTIAVADSYFSAGTVTNNGTVNVSGASELNGTFEGKSVKFADGTTLTSTDGVIFKNKVNASDMTFGAGDFTADGMELVNDDVVFAEGSNVTVTGTLASYNVSNLKINSGAEVSATSIYINGGDVEIDGKLATLSGPDGGFIMNGKGTVTVNKGGVLDVVYTDAYYTTGNMTVDVYGTAKVSFKLSDGKSKFTWNIYDGGTLEANKNGIVLNNAESVINVYGKATATSITNNAVINVNGGELVADSLTNNGTVTVSGESTLVIGDLDSEASALMIENADLTASSIAGEKSYINVKGENTYDGTLDAYWIKVGDVDNAEPEYTGSLSFSKDSSVKAAVLQVAAGGSLTYGSADETFANAFNVSELYAAEDSDLTIQNVEAGSNISVLFAQGNTVIDNADIKGHDLVLGNTAGDAELLIKDSAVTLGGSSNAVVIIGDAAGGALNLENADVTVNRVGPGSSWQDTTSDVLTVGYKDAVTSVSIDADSTLTVNNDVAISANSTIDLAGTFTASGEIVNAGTVNIFGTTASINGSFTNSGMFNIIDAEFAGSFTNAENGIFTIEDAAFTGVITNNGAVELNGDVTLSVGAVTGTAAADEDGDAALNITGFAGAGDVIKFAGDLSQIVTVNGSAVDYVGDKYTFTVDETLYYLTETDDQISASEWADVEDIAVTVDVAQADNSYKFTFTVTAEGATAYTLVLNGQEYAFAEGENTFIWTGEGYADTLPDSFNYYVVVSGDKAYGKSKEATVDIIDYTVPAISNFELSPEGENMFFNFNVSDNRGVAEVELWIDGAKAEDIAFATGTCRVDVTQYAGQEYQVIVSDAAGNFRSVEGVLPEEVLDPAPGEDVIVTPGTTAVTGTIDSEEYIIVNVGAEGKLDVIGNIENTDVFNHIIVNDNAELNVSGTVKGNGSLYVAQDAAVNFKEFEGTKESDNIYIGNDSAAVFENVDMKDGYDTAYVEDVTFSAAKVNSLENLNITNGGSVVVTEAYTATEASIVKVGTGSTFAAGSIAGAGKVNLTLGNNASAVVGTATLNKLTVSAGAAFTAGTVTGNGDDVFSFSGNRYAVIEGIAFGDGNDAIVMSRGANLILTGAVTDLERISANSSNRIFVTGDFLDENIAGYNANIVEEINFNSIIADDGKDSLFVLDADQTLTLGEAAEVEYYSLTDKTWYTASGDSFSGADISLVKVKDDYTSTATLA